MRLPQVPVSYSPQIERERNRTLEIASFQYVRRDDDVEIGANQLVLTSPNGTRYSVTVDNSGNLGTTAL